MLRPHRPAPVVPPGGQNLSAQQIQRRLERERIQQQQQQVYGNSSSSNSEAEQVASLMREVGEDATQAEALMALKSANWDMTKAIRHLKIERLVR